MLSPMSLQLSILARDFLFFNQRHAAWTQPYPWDGHETLHTSGCGIFALCHCIQWLTGSAPDPLALADFSLTHGGRGDDGTDRPALLAALETSGKAAAFGFSCPLPALQNDLCKLYAFLMQECGVAMANIRPGHIVSIIKAREQQGQRQVLIIDSYAESGDPRILHGVREELTNTRITYERDGQLMQGFAAYWVDLSLVRDFNLLESMI